MAKPVAQSDATRGTKPSPRLALARRSCMVAHQSPTTHADDMRISVTPQQAPTEWELPCTREESSIHQLSPYIGKLKSRIARDLLLEHTRPNDLVADPFCGCGTIPLEAVSLGRRMFASDTSPYAVVLTKGKLQAPATLEGAERQLARVLGAVANQPLPSTAQVPDWVRKFFHPTTLAEVIRVSRYLVQSRRYFLLSCLLGILHHQRPGFLSYPASNLVPYLRTKNFPRDSYPQLYGYRSIEPRIRAKVTRAFARPAPVTTAEAVVRKASIQNVTLPKKVNCIITSPPYMNALDYARDNRLRMWFLDGNPIDTRLDNTASTPAAFRELTRVLARKAQKSVVPGGRCVVVVGERVTRRGAKAHPSSMFEEEFLANAPSFRLMSVIHDRIPDVRRSRRNHSGVKREHILVFSKESA